MLPGCTAGTGGTGEIVVPPQRLREVEAVRPAQLPATRPSTAPAATAMPTTQPALPPQIAMTLEQVRQMALANNLDLRVALFAPEISRQGISEEQARYEALFTTDASYNTNRSPTASELVGSRTQDLSVAPSVTLPLRTGGTLQFSLPVDRFETDNQFSTLNPAYTTPFNASLTLPLLRGAGLYYNTQGIRIAFYQYEVSAAQTKLEVIRVLADADRVYWRLYAARQVLVVRKQEYDLAVQQYDSARRRQQQGLGTEADVVRAESGVADAAENIIIAENAVRQRQRELKRILNQPGLGMETPTILVPATRPDATEYHLDGTKLVDVALRQRMEMLELELQIAEQSAIVRNAQSDLLPLVSLTYNYRVNALGSSFDASLTQLGRKQFEGHTVGLHVEVPIGNEAARSRLRRALLTRLQQLATKDQRTEQIRQEVFDALDSLQASWQRILAAQKRVIAAARVADAEVRQFNAGLRTSTDVVQAQARLANAKSDEIAALTEYQIAQVDIAFATGTLLGATKVVWQPSELGK